MILAQPNDSIRRFNIPGVLILVFWFVISLSGCESKLSDNVAKAVNFEQVERNYLSRLRSRDKSLLEDLNAITDKDIEVTGWRGVRQSKKGFFLQIKNSSNKVLFLHPPNYSFYSNIHERNGEKWVGISIEIGPSTVIPYILLPGSEKVIHMPFKNDLPDDVNLQCNISLPVYDNISDNGLLQYSQFKIIKRFNILRGKALGDSHYLGDRHGEKDS